jgi:hypothetical protein
MRAGLFIQIRVFIKHLGGVLLSFLENTNLSERYERVKTESG